MERYELHVEIDGNLLVYRYNVPAEPFETVISDARFHKGQGRTVVLYRENVQNGCGWLTLERVLTFT
jgi:hypothetical protein